MTTRNVVGIDASLTATGIALHTGHTITIRPRAGAREPARRLNELAEAVSHALWAPADLAVIEGYSYGSPNTRTLCQLAELGGLIRLRLFELAIPYVEVPPATLKHWATGNGRAPKSDMILEARRRARTLGDPPPAADDAADAYLLRAAGLAHLAGTLPAGDTITRLAWPRHLRKAPT